MKNKIRFLMAALAVVFCFCGSTVVAYAGGGEEVSDDTAVTEAEQASSAEDERTAFTPEGTGTVVDTATNEDGKQFYTISTPAGNVFYLIIDLERTSDNVYFLNAVTEKDLLALAEQAGDTSGTTATDAVTQTPVTPEPETDEDEVAADTEEETSSGGNSGSLVFILIAVLAAGGVGYYFKIYKPKQQGADPDDDFDEEYDDDDDSADEYDDTEYEDETYSGYQPEDGDSTDSEETTEEE